MINFRLYIRRRDVNSNEFSPVSETWKPNVKNADCHSLRFTRTHRNAEISQSILMPSSSIHVSSTVSGPISPEPISFIYRRFFVPVNQSKYLWFVNKLISYVMFACVSFFIWTTLWDRWQRSGGLQIQFTFQFIQIDSITLNWCILIAIVFRCLFDPEFLFSISNCRKQQRQHNQHHRTAMTVAMTKKWF